jgi:hypothetical protein
MLTLMSEDYMGWTACTRQQAQEFANEGVATVGIDTEKVVVILPDDNVGTGRASTDTVNNVIPHSDVPFTAYAKQTVNVSPSESMTMQYYAYNNTLTTQPINRSMKIYLSPACHEHDNTCSYSSQCGENIHCNRYMDYLSYHLKVLGFSVKRGSKYGVGTPEINSRTAEANNWPADLYYVCHTNAYNGTIKDSRTFVDSNDAKAVRWANKLVEWRNKIYPYGSSVKYTVFNEDTLTNMPCIYDEIVFHDNIDSVSFFHDNMAGMAINTANAIREIYDQNI